MVTFPNVTPDEISGNAALFQYLSRKIVDYITFLEMLAFNSSLFILFRYRELRPKKKNTLVSGNAGDEKNLHPGGREFIYFDQFN